MHFGFSYVGLIFLLMMFIPNFFWTKNKPAEYDKYAARESRPLLVFERIGEAAVSVLCLIFSDFNVGVIRPWSLWLAGAAAMMLLYEIYWLRYFKSPKTMADFYRGLLFIPLPGASCPVIAFALLAVYGKNPFLGAAAVILGIGHIGIHYNHKKEQEKQEHE